MDARAPTTQSPIHKRQAHAKHLHKHIYAKDITRGILHRNTRKLTKRVAFECACVASSSARELLPPHTKAPLQMHATPPDSHTFTLTHSHTHLHIHHREKMEEQISSIEELLAAKTAFEHILTTIQDLNPQLRNGITNILQGIDRRLLLRVVQARPAR